MKMDVERLGGFLEDACGLGLRLAFEFRHESWFCSEVYSVLKTGSAALCTAESDELTTPEVHTASFSCYRLRRSEYSTAEIAALASKFKERAAEGDVFAYFKHEETPTGALRAVSLLEELREHEHCDVSLGSRGVDAALCGSISVAQQPFADFGRELPAAEPFFA